MYWGTGYDITRHTFERIEGQKFGAGMFLHIPYDLASGRLDMTAVEAVESAGTPDSYSLGAAYPNPFNPETTIEFNVPTEGFVEIDVFNAVGPDRGQPGGRGVERGVLQDHLERA